MNEKKQIAQDATFQIACAMEHINWLLGVLHVLRDRFDACKDEHYGTVADLAIFNASDWHNSLDCERESLEERTESAFAEPMVATQSDESGNVSRIPEGSDKTFAERLLIAREGASLSQDELAKLVGIEQISISQLEIGKTKRTSYLAEIARACRVDVNWLAFGSEISQ
jgi:DNA-binding XRE family transcriptional regulator